MARASPWSSGRFRRLAEAIRLSRWWPHSEVGLGALRARPLQASYRTDRRGRQAFRCALDLRPQDWSNFYRGLCSFRLRQFDNAVADFRACLAIEPGSAVAHYNRPCPPRPRPTEDTIGDIPGRSNSPDLAARRTGGFWPQAGRNAEALLDFDAGLGAGLDGTARAISLISLAQLALHHRSSARVNAETAVQLGCREAARFSINCDLRNN